MALIFFLSAQSAEVSSKTSGGIIEFIVSIIVPDFENLSAVEQTAIIEGWQFYVRKIAHAALYFGLGTFSYLCFIPYRSISLPKRTFLGFFISALYSVSDEYHQTFVEGRSGELRDIAIDCAGALIAVLLALLINHLIRKKKGKIKMKKRDLISQNNMLAKSCENYKFELKKIKQENEILCEQLASVREQSSALAEELEALKNAMTSPIAAELAPETIEDTVIEPAVEEISAEVSPENAETKAITLDNATSFGAQIIGKIVLKAATHCNSLSADFEPAYAKELINLILGRTEVAKAEILSIVSSEADMEIKKSMILSEQNACEDYFLSVLAQKG